MRSAIFVGSSREDLRTFPEDVQDVLGFALSEAQGGRTPKEAKPMHGFRVSVQELVDRDGTGTYRLMYTVKLTKGVYVLHCFQKKSTIGIKTPQRELNTVARRLQTAIEIDALP